MSSHPLPDQAVTAGASPAPAAGPTAAGKANSVAPRQANAGAAGGQAGPSGTAANGEKQAERAKGDRHTGKCDGGGGGGAAAEPGKVQAKGKAEKSKTHKPAKAQLVNPSPSPLSYDKVFVFRKPPGNYMPYCNLPAASQSALTHLFGDLRPPSYC